VRVLLIYPDVKVHVNYPLGLGFISSLLKREGHETRILHFNEEIGNPLNMDVLERNVRDFEPQLIGFSSTSNQFQYVKQMADCIKKKHDVPILVGGIHATIASEKVLNVGTIDLVCRGEGEFSVVDLLGKLENGEDYSGVPNIGFKYNGTIQLNPIRPLIDEETMESLPLPDRDGFNFEEILRKKKGWANVMASRGCLNKCTYCVNHFFHDMYGSTLKNLRYRKIDTIFREIEEMMTRYSGIELINFDDDNITLKKNWLEEFCDEYPKRIGLPFACNVHPAKFDLQRAKMLAKAGCVEVKMGIESGSERLRRDVLRRPGREEIMVNAFAAAEEAGLRAWSFNMIGIPTETREEMLSTAQLNAKIRPYIIRCSIFFPYEGTELYGYAKEHKLIKEERAERVSTHLEDSVLDMPQLSREEIVKFKTMFKWYVDAYSEIDSSPVVKALIELFEKLPADKWVSGEAQKLFHDFDRMLDTLLRELRIEHYATRRHLDLNFSKKLNFELP
jgi:anaerobic magnesium-protoporphyrin IX monomethyl ester cyclase